MTDKEMIKALECCLNTPVNCDNCAYTKYPVRDCNKILIKDITDLINRQQAEIDILKSELNDCERKNYDLENRIVYTEATIVKIRAEAIEEFARKLKCGVSITSGIITSEDVDNLVKEIVGTDNG